MSALKKFLKATTGGLGSLSTAQVDLEENLFPWHFCPSESVQSFSTALGRTSRAESRLSGTVSGGQAVGSHPANASGLRSLQNLIFLASSPQPRPQPGIPHPVGLSGQPPQARRVRALTGSPQAGPAAMRYGVSPAAPVFWSRGLTCRPIGGGPPYTVLGSRLQASEKWVHWFPRGLSSYSLQRSQTKSGWIPGGMSSA